MTKTTTSDVVSTEIREARYPSWFSEEGIALKRIALIAKGFPMPLNWVMITLTCDPSKFDNDPAKAYRYIMDSDNSGTNNRVNYYLRKIIAKLIKWGYFSSLKTVCHWRKLEFQQNEFPHWHVYLNLTDKLTKSQLAELRSDWIHGTFVNFSFQKKGSNPYYVFKYAFKSPLKRAKFDSEGRLLDEFYIADTAVPGWFGDALWFSDRDSKHKSYARARFFQTSRNFYQCYNNWCAETGQDPEKARMTALSCRIEKEKEKEKDNELRDQVLSFLPLPLREVIKNQFHRAQLVSRDANGKYLSSKTVFLSQPFRKIERKVLIPAVLRGDALMPHKKTYVLKELPDWAINKNNKIDLCKIQKKTRRTFKEAQTSLDLSISMRSKKLASVCHSYATLAPSKTPPLLETGATILRA